MADDVDFSSVFGSASGDKFGADFDSLSLLCSWEGVGFKALDESCRESDGGWDCCLDGPSICVCDEVDLGEGDSFSVRVSIWSLGGVGLLPIIGGRELVEESSTISGDGRSALPSSLSSSSSSLPYTSGCWRKHSCMFLGYECQ